MDLYTENRQQQDMYTQSNSSEMYEEDNKKYKCQSCSSCGGCN